MSTRIMYSWLGSSEIQSIVPLLKDDTTTINNEHKEVQTIPEVGWPEVAPVPKTRAPWDDRPSSYVAPRVNVTIDEDTTEPRLLYPNYRPTNRKFTGNPNDPSVFMKAQNFKKIHPHNSEHYAECTAQEMNRCEQISRHAHPNLAQYLGVQTKKFDGCERVTRIVYKRYSMDLYAFVLEKKLLKEHHIAFLLDGIRAGMQALHAMELVHCDLRPMNIFITIGEGLDEAGNAVLEEVVLGDFDASVKIGESIELKRASREWWPEEAKFRMMAETWMDEWCLEKLENWLNGDWEEEKNCGW